MAVGSGNGSDQTARGGGQEEPPQGAGREAQASDFVGKPDADGTPAAGAGIAVAAKDAASADDVARGGGVIKAAQRAMANEVANDMAMRTGRQLESFDEGVPILSAIAEPPYFGHADCASVKNAILPQRERGGVKARYDRSSLSEVRGKSPGWPLPNSRCNKQTALRRQFGKMSRKMRSERGKGHLWL